jgi:hypothetical protein
MMRLFASCALVRGLLVPLLAMVLAARDMVRTVAITAIATVFIMTILLAAWVTAARTIASTTVVAAGGTIRARSLLFFS